ncbi:hypothetical protein Tco_0753032 [Tanacetum coccineum]
MDEVVVNPAITIKVIRHQWYRSTPFHEDDLSATKCLKNMVCKASGLPVISHSRPIRSSEPLSLRNKRGNDMEAKLEAIERNQLYTWEQVGKKYSGTLPKRRIANRHQATSIAKCSDMKQALPNTTNAEARKPEVAKEVGGRKKKQIEQRPPLSVRSSRSSSPTKPTTPCSSLSALAGESLRMNVGLDRGIKTSSTGRERIGESVTEMKAGDRIVWDLLLRALEASNQPARSRSEVYYLTKGCVSGIRAKLHAQLALKTFHSFVSTMDSLANNDLRLQEGNRQPPSSKDFFEGGALLYSFAHEAST